MSEGYDGPSRRGRLLSVESIAGWVFADLLLVLFLVGLGSAIAYTPPEPPPPVKEKPEKEAPIEIVGMKTKPTSITIDIDGALLGRGTALTKPQQASVCEAIASRVEPLAGEKAALVLIFGGAADVTTGQNVARALSAQLPCADEGVFDRGLPTRAFWDGTLPLGKARLEVFLFLQQTVS